MRTGAAAGYDGYLHETALYRSDDELVGVARPFLREGIEAGEHVLVSCGERTTELLRRAVGTSSAMTFRPAEETMRRPASSIKEFRSFLASCVREGAEQIRVLGEVPHPGTGAPWGGWSRYEATVNHALDGFPVWGICPYDERTTPTDVLADVRATHAFLAAPDGAHAPNPAYVEPARFLASRPPSAPDPIQATEATVDLLGPSPREARDAVAWLAMETTIAREDVDALTIGVSEVVTNAIVHGEPPVEVRAWEDHDRVVVTVDDAGPGPRDPFVGLVPPGDEVAGGRGLWITHQLCDDVEMTSSPDGFTIRLVAGRTR